MGVDSSNMPNEDMDDLTGVMWNDRMWLQLFPLNQDTALQYFSQSQFYDRRCNNELITMQRLDNSLLSTMAGIEYAVAANPSPNLFIITKSRRTITPPSLEPLATYYIIDGNVYQAPSIHSVLSTRVLQSLHHLRGAFETMQNAVALSGQGRYVWDPPPVANEERADVAVPDSKDLISGAERRAVDRMLYDVLEKNRRINASQLEEKHNASAEPLAVNNEGGAATVTANQPQQGLKREQSP